MMISLSLNQITSRITCINAFHLKGIAITSMVIDHIGLVFFPDLLPFRIIGRITFPIFAYLIVQGFIHTHDLRKYFHRLLLWAFLSEIPFDLFQSQIYFDWEHQNVLFTLFLGLLALYVIKASIDIPIKIVAVIAIILFSLLIHADYSYYGIILVLVFYFTYMKPPKLFLASNFLHFFFWSKIQAFAILSSLPIFLYNGSRGKKTGIFFYAFYPAHMLIIFLLSKYIN